MQRDQARAGKLRAVRHGAGGLRLRHQRTRHRGRAPHGDDGLLPAGVLHADRAARCCAPKRACSLRRAAPSSTASAPPAGTHPQFAGAVQHLFDHLLPRARRRGPAASRASTHCSTSYGFDRGQHEQHSGGPARRPHRSGAESSAGHEPDRGPARFRRSSTPAASSRRDIRAIGRKALADGAVAVVSLAGGVGSRWTKGAGVVKALNPFCRLGGRHRSFIETHLAKSRRVGRECGTLLPHVDHHQLSDPRRRSRAACARSTTTATPGPLLLSPGRAIGLRMVPTERDLRFAWEEMPQQVLDEQAQKVRESLHADADRVGARRPARLATTRDNLPTQCLHPVGHWYEIPNLLRNGVLRAAARRAARGSKHLMVHNVDTVGADVDAGLLGYHIEQGAAMTAEVIERHVEDRGGGLARVDGRLRLVEGMALPDEEVESRLSCYNSATYWIDIDRLLGVFGLGRGDLADDAQGQRRRRRAGRPACPTYITLKDVKKRWGKGQEDVFPVAQFEKLWGDMTALPEWDCGYVARLRASAASSSKSPRSSTAGCATARRRLSRSSAIGRQEAWRRGQRQRTERVWVIAQLLCFDVRPLQI